MAVTHCEKLNGRIDRACVEALQARLESVLPGCDLLELDASGVTYVCSDGFRMLMRLSRGGEVAVTHARRELCDQFDAAGMSAFLREEKLTERVSRLFSRHARRQTASLPDRHRMAWLQA